MGTRDVRGEWSWRVGMPVRMAQQQRACGHDLARWGRSTCRVTQRLQRGRSSPVATGARVPPGGEQIKGLTVSDPAKASNHRRNAPLFSSLWDEATIGSGENGRRYRRHHPASSKRELAGTYPYNSKLPFRAGRASIRLQQRCNLDSPTTVRTRFFHRICNLARPMETPLCKISF